MYSQVIACVNTPYSPACMYVYSHGLLPKLHRTSKYINNQDLMHPFHAEVQKRLNASSGNQCLLIARTFRYSHIKISSHDSVFLYLKPRSFLQVSTTMLVFLKLFICASACFQEAFSGIKQYISFDCNPSCEHAHEHVQTACSAKLSPRACSKFVCSFE
jgi:hypothetical protein